MKVIYSAGVFFLLSAFASLVITGNKIHYKSLLSGNNSNEFDEKAVVITLEKEFLSTWNKLSAGEFGKAEDRPETDLKKNAIIVIYSGSETNGMEIDSTYIVNNRLMVAYSRISLGPKCNSSKLLVTPFEMIEVPKGNWKECSLRSHVKYQDCD